jgi:iron complex transport system substrate-binding protein
MMNKRVIKIGLSILLLLGLLSFGYLVATHGDISPSFKSKSTKSESYYPVTVQSCGMSITFDSAPKRALSFDTNMTEMMLALDLQDRMVGYWISGVQVADEYKEKIKNVTLISKETSQAPGMETILSFNPDFVFGAWNYNFSNESGVTPDKLAQSGVKSYVLTESCIATGMNPGTDLEGTYQDIMNLGAIFNKKDRAQQIVDQMRSNIVDTQKTIGEVKTPLRGFFYGGGVDTAFSAGKYGMASKLMTLVGAQNILGDIEKDWIPTAGWETIIEKDPQFIMMVDSPWGPVKDKIKILESSPKLSNITAIKNKKYIIFPWTYILPGMEMDKGVALLARNLYPDKSH